MRDITDSQLEEQVIYYIKKYLSLKLTKDDPDIKIQLLLNGKIISESQVSFPKLEN